MVEPLVRVCRIFIALIEIMEWGGVIRRGAGDYLFAADRDVSELRSYFEQRAQMGGVKEREQYHKIMEAITTMDATFHDAQRQAPAENVEEGKFREAYFKFVMVNTALDPRQQRAFSEDKFLENLAQHPKEFWVEKANGIMRKSYMVSEMLEVLEREGKEHGLKSIPRESSKLETEVNPVLAKLLPEEKILAVHAFANTLPEHQRDVYREVANRYALAQGVDTSVIKDWSPSLEA